MLVIRKQDLQQIFSHALDGYPLEVCGLLVGTETVPSPAGQPEDQAAVDRLRQRSDAGLQASGNPHEAEPGKPPAAAFVELVVATENVAGSSRVYEIAPKALLQVDRLAESRGFQIVGVYHSHTHTEAKPSPTDIAKAPDPYWHYVLVSLRDVHPALRSWKIEGGKIEEEKVVVKW